MRVQTFFEVYEITALFQAHFLVEPRQLIQIGRIVGYSSNPRLRQILFFHFYARSDFREPVFSDTVRSTQRNQLCHTWQVLSESCRIYFKLQALPLNMPRLILHKK